MKRSLDEYKKKRNLKKTPEPGPSKVKQKSKKDKLIFVIQEHHARNLHYDFRLEWKGVLKSWAVPKGPSEDPSVKRLAVQTEDHPLDYAKFKGTIPKGEYGAGKVLIWDHGIWEPQGSAAAGFKKGHLEFTLKGKKLRGKWRLIKTPKNWLLMKVAEEDVWPEFIPPQLPRLVTAAPDDDDWIHEIKYDGYRIQSHLKNGTVHLYTRNGLDWSSKFPDLLKRLSELAIKNAIFDGEIVSLDSKGVSHFQDLQNALSSKKVKGLKYYVFDLLYLDGRDLRKLPLLERKAFLKKILSRSSEQIVYSEHIVGNGSGFFKVSCDHGLEGIVSKLADSSYISGRGDFWVKTKCSKRQEFVVGGYTVKQNGKKGFGALLIGVFEKGKFCYTGKVGTGFTQETEKELMERFTNLHRKSSPFDSKSPKEKGLHWLTPRIVVEVSFSNWTDEGVLRQPVFQGVRLDKRPEGVSHEQSLSSPEKIVFRKEKLTKADVSKYYKSVSKYILPHIKDRILSIVRCPEGSEGSCFYQKHLAEVPLDRINSPADLSNLIQLNALEIHACNCHRQDPEHPDQIVIDFDPDPSVSWKEVVSGAFILKELLEKLKLKSFVKLTGGKGLHVHIPIAPLYDWEQIKAFSKTIALEMISRNPNKFTVNASKRVRKGKIFLDYLRNGPGATSVAPYSLRARAMSTIALPIGWDELKRIKGPGAFTMRNGRRKIQQRGSDPWKGMLGLKQKISILKPSKSTD